MPAPPIDLRSDTVTRPTPGMRAALAAAEVGDDVIDRDPTIDRLERRIAERLGHEAAVFMPSGTMTNQVALRVHCRPGDEFLCDAECHIFNYEQGAYAQLSGLAVRTVAGAGGVLRVEQLRGLIRGDDEHLVRTRLVCLENTHNRGGGRVLPWDAVAAISAWAREHGLARHLDGARLFNAAVASGVAVDRWAGLFDTVSVCFSKGLGAPVGSALVGSREAMAVARRHRKLFGGAVRQGGVLAAAALYALDHHVDRLAEDHALARRLAERLAAAPAVRLDPAEVDTNIVIFRVDPAIATAAEFCRQLRERGVWMLPFGAEHVRAVTHLDVDAAQIDAAGQAVIEAAERLAHTSP